MARTFNLVELRTQARQRADQETGDYISDDELTSYINSAYAELYDLIVQSCETYFIAYFDVQIPTAWAGAEIFDLPVTFYKVLGVDWLDSSTSLDPISLRAFNFQERNRSSFLRNGLSTSTSMTNVQYMIQGSAVRLIPKPVQSGVLRVWYAPMAKILKDLTMDQPVDVPQGYSYSFLPSAVDTSADTITITNHGYSLGDPINNQNVGGSSPFPTGVDVYVIPVTKNTFRIAQTLDNAFRNSYYDITSSGTGVNYLQDNFNKVDGINGFEEFIIWDCVVKMLNKEESDASLAMAEKMRAIKRVQEGLANRDQGESWRTIDIYGNNEGELLWP